MAGGDERPDVLRREVALAVLLLHGLSHAQRGVQTGEVHGVQGAHPMVESQHARAVDVLNACDALFDDSHRLESQRDDEPRGDEARRVLATNDGLLAVALREGERRLDGCVRGLDTTDKFDQVHHRRRIEPVRPDEAIRSLGRGGKT